MDIVMRTRRHRLIYVLGILVVLVALAGPAVSQPAVSAAQRGAGAGDRGPVLTEQPAADEMALDLGAMTLTPHDLDAEGLAGYGVASGAMTFPDAVMVASVAESKGLPEAEVRATFEDAGFARRYDSYLYRPEDDDDPAGPAGRMVVSYVLEFAGADGAAAAWDLVEDESASATAEDGARVDEFGDQTEATRDQGEDAATGGRNSTSRSAGQTSSRASPSSTGRARNRTWRRPRRWPHACWNGSRRH